MCFPDAQTTSTPCGYVGLADVGCSSADCNAWILDTVPSTIAHELGHNAGLPHSAIDIDNNGVYSAVDEECVLVLCFCC